METSNLISETKNREAVNETPCQLLQGILDDNKEQLTDELYLQLCNRLLDANKTLNKYCFYEVYYTKTVVKRVSEIDIDIELVPEKRILRINTQLFSKWKTETRDDDEKSDYSKYVYLSKCLESIINKQELLPHFNCHGEASPSLKVSPDCHIISYEEITTRNS